MVEVKNLTKYYGPAPAVRDISFSIAKGELIGFLGPNGAGKTTTMNILTGCLSMSGGSVRIGGEDILDEPTEIRKMIGYLPETPPLYGEMTVIEYLGFVAGLKKIPRSEHRNETDLVCRRVGLNEVRTRLINNLSKGYRQRVGLAQALMGDPRLIILDEPTVGLDPRQIREIRQLIQELSRERTVILSSHILPEVQAVCERILIINRGRIVIDEKTDALIHRLSGAGGQLLEVRGAPDHVKKILGGIDGVGELRCEESAASGITSVEFSLTEEDIREKIFFAMADARLPILRMQPRDISLEKIFLATLEEEESEFALNDRQNGGEEAKR